MVQDRHALDRVRARAHPRYQAHRLEVGVRALVRRDRDTPVGDGYLAALSNMVYSRSLPLATRDLVIHRMALGESAVMIGAAHLVIDQLLEPDYYAAWGGEAVPPPL